MSVTLTKKFTLAQLKSFAKDKDISNRSSAKTKKEVADLIVKNKYKISDVEKYTSSNRASTKKQSKKDAGRKSTKAGRKSTKKSESEDGFFSNLFRASPEKHNKGRLQEMSKSELLKTCKNSGYKPSDCSEKTRLQLITMMKDNWTDINSYLVRKTILTWTPENIEKLDNDDLVYLCTENAIHTKTKCRRLPRAQLIKDINKYIKDNK